MYKGDKRKAGGTFLITLLFLIFVFSKNVFGFDFQPKEIIPDTLEIENTSHTRPVLGLALSGGGAKGLAHVGVLKVIEEAGLEVDVVSGTSMGAIVGGLYAMGYSVEELESLALSTDWVGILNDQPSRREMAMEQKQYEGRYSLSLPLSGWNVALPSGVIAGQKVGKLLVNLTWPVHHVSDFRDLPRAFSCVATDIQSGEAVVLDHGFLPEAMRASFSIPSIMTPVMMDNQLLIDGFVARNLPAEDAKALGADILIGVDVGRNPLNPDQINSFIDVLNQTMSIQGEKANVEQRKLCDFLISPQLNDLEFMDFTNAKEFIIRGEEAAREFLPQLRALADSLNQSEKVRPFYHPIAGDSVRVLKVIVNGLEKTDETLIQGLLDFKIPQNVSKKQLELNVDRIYSSLFFERVTYKTLPVPGGVNLIINVVEKEADQLNFGFHYDTEDKAAVLLNATLYNRLWSNSTLSFDVRLGNNTGTRLDYIKYIGVRPRVGFGISVSTYESDQMLSATALDPTADALFMIPFSYQHDLLDITFGTTISTHSLIGIGFDIESMTFSVDNVTEAQAKILNQTYDSVHAYLMWYFDSLDQIVFPKNGLMFNAVVKQGVDIEDQEADVGNVVYNREFQLMGALPLNKKWVLQNKIIIGYHDGGTIPLPRFNYGGVDNFYGMKSGEMSGNKTFMVRAAVQWEPWTRKYIIVGTDVGMAGDSIELSPDELENGFGITLGMLTPLGPVQWTTHSGTGSGAGTHIRIGYHF